MEVKGRIRLSKNNVTDANGLAIPPLLSDLDYGQVAVNYSKDDPCLFFKKNGVDGDEIVKIVTEEKIAQTLSEILGGAAADLDTLKELLDKFTGSDNDVLNLITAIQAEVAKKADKTTLSNHTGSTSNPHSVTAEQVGALPVGGTAATAKTLTNYYLGDWSRKPAQFPHVSTEAHMMVHSALGLPSRSWYYDTLWNCGYNGADVKRTHLLAIGKSDTADMYLVPADFDSQEWKDPIQIYHSKSSNSYDYNWTARTLFAGKGEFGKNENSIYSRITNNAHWFINTDGSVRCGLTYAATDYEPVWRNGDASRSIFHSGNCNNSSTDWLCKELYSYGQIRTITPTGENTSIKSYNGYQSFFDNGRFNYGVDNNIGLGFVSGGAERLTILPTGETIIGSLLNGGGFLSIKPQGYNVDNLPILIQGLYANNGKRQDICIQSLGGNVGVGVKAPYEKLHVDGGVLSNKVVVPPLLEVNGGFFHVANKQIGSTPDGKVPVILIASIPTNNADKTNKSGCSGRFSFYRGSTTSYDVSGYIDITAFRSYDALNTNTGISTYGFNIGTCSFEGKKWIAIKLKNGFAQSSVYFDGDYSGDCKFRVISTDNIVDWVGIDMAPSNINSSVDVDGSITSTGEVIAYKAATALQEGTPSGSLGIVYDGLDSSEPDVALSANQGRILNENVTAVRTLANEAATTATWNNIIGCPSEFAPTAHNHYDASYVSDRRLKSNIETIENGLEHCLSMNPVQYDWTQEALDRFGFASTKAYGMIAQEMELLLPHVTKKIDDHTLSIDYIQTIPFLVSAIKQLHALIKEANINNNTKTRAVNRAYAEEKTNAQVIAGLRSEIEELKKMVYAK